MTISDGKFLKYLVSTFVIIIFSAMILSCGGDKDVQTEDPSVVGDELITISGGAGGAGGEKIAEETIEVYRKAIS